MSSNGRWRRRARRIRDDKRLGAAQFERLEHRILLDGEISAAQSGMVLEGVDALVGWTDQVENAGVDPVADLSIFDIQSIFDGIATWMSAYLATERFDQQIPMFDGVALNDVLDPGIVFRSALTDPLAARLTPVDVPDGEDPPPIDLPTPDDLVTLLPAVTGYQFDGSTSSVIFDVAINQAIETVPADLLLGLNLGTVTDLELTAPVTATLSPAVSASLQIGMELRDLGSEFRMTPAMSLDALNAGFGVARRTAVVAAAPAPSADLPAQIDLALSIDQQAPIELTLDLTEGGIAPSLTDLRAMINLAIARAVDEQGADIPVTASTIDDRLVLALDDGAGARLNVGGAEALGFATDQQGNTADLAFHVGDGTVVEANLDGIATVGELITAVGALRRPGESAGDPPILNLAIEPTLGHALVVTDLTGSDDVPFRIKRINQSRAIFDLGLTAIDGNDEVEPDGVIIGNPLHGETVFDLGFVRDVIVDGSVAVTTPADIQATANLGIVAVNVAGGRITMHHAMHAPLVNPATGSAADHITIAELMGQLESPEDIAPDATVTGSVVMDMPFSVPGGLLGTAVPGAPAFTIDVVDIYATGVVQPLLNPDAAPLEPFLNLTSTDVVDVLRGGATVLLDDLLALPDLANPLILLNRSAAELVGLDAAFAQAVEAFAQQAPPSLNDLETTLEAAFGVPAGDPSELIDVTIDAGSGVRLAFDIDLARAAAQPIRLDLNLADEAIDGLPRLVDADGQSPLATAASADLRLRFGFDLTNGASPDAYLDDQTRLDLTVAAGQPALVFDVPIGPVGTTVAGTVPMPAFARIDLDGDAATSDAATFSITLSDMDPQGDGRHLFDAPPTYDISSQVAGTATAHLPFLYQNAPLGQLDLLATSIVEVPPGNPGRGPGDVAGGAALDAALDGVVLAPGFDLGDDLAALATGVPRILDRLAEASEIQAFDGVFPVVGDELFNRAVFLREISEALADNFALNPGSPYDLAREPGCLHRRRAGRPGLADGPPVGQRRPGRLRRRDRHAVRVRSSLRPEAGPAADPRRRADPAGNGDAGPGARHRRRAR